MNTLEVVNFFGNKATIARVLDISSVAVTKWREIVPKGRALELEKLTGGALKCDLSLYKSRQRKSKHRTSKEA